MSDLARVCSVTPNCPKPSLRHCIGRFRHGGVLACWVAKTEARDRFGTWGDPATRTRLKYGQGVCGARSGGWDLVPALFHQHLDILRQADNVPVL